MIKNKLGDFMQKMVDKHGQVIDDDDFGDCNDYEFYTGFDNNFDNKNSQMKYQGATAQKQSNGSSPIPKQFSVHNVDDEKSADKSKSPGLNKSNSPTKVEAAYPEIDRHNELEQ